MTKMLQAGRLALLAAPCFWRFRVAPRISTPGLALPARTAAPAGQTFAVVAQDPRDAGGLEFAQYASLVAAQMAKVGYVQGDPQTADLIVKFEYGVDRGHEHMRTTGAYDPFWGPWYGGGWGGGWGRGWGGGWGGWGRGWGYGWYDPFGAVAMAASTW
jgi:hypothetical protein